MYLWIHWAKQLPVHLLSLVYCILYNKNYKMGNCAVQIVLNVVFTLQPESYIIALVICVLKQHTAWADKQFIVNFPLICQFLRNRLSAIFPPLSNGPQVLGLSALLHRVPASSHHRAKIPSSIQPTLSTRSLRFHTSKGPINLLASLYCA